MDFPTWEKNAQVETVPVTITAPAFNASEPDPAKRFIDQQWRDAAKAGLGDRHPFSLNRDASPIAGG